MSAAPESGLVHDRRAFVANGRSAELQRGRSLQGQGVKRLKSVRATPMERDMQLREHPCMSFQGRSNWPPVWLRRGWEPRSWHVKIGEIGVLQSVRYHASRPNRIYLTIVHEEAEYVGCLLLDDNSFCEEVAEHLPRYRNMSIQMIGTCEFVPPLEFQ